MSLLRSIQIALLLIVLTSVDTRINSKEKKSFHLGNRENGDEDPIAHTENGKVRGSKNRTAEFSKTYYAFNGIPFAKPPINELRFEPPQPADKWEGIYQTTNDSKACTQSGIPLLGEEDCLYLNVYTPNLPISENSKSPNLLPVMVYIYGGGFIYGNTSSRAYGPDFLIDQNVVVVSLNYRLGILGFMTTGDLVAPGNAGLKDQHLALKWVQTNIWNFGGDPKKVTIFGESAGSASVSYHVKSPKSKGLFRGAIQESGAVLCPWALARRVAPITHKIALLLGANTTSSKTLIADLKKVDLLKLITFATTIATADVLVEGFLDGLMFGPVVEPEHEDAFFTGKSHQELSEGKFNRVPAIIGLNSQEGNFLFESASFPTQFYLTAYNLNISRIVPIDMNVSNLTAKYSIGNEIKVRYFGRSSLFGANKSQSSKFLSDVLFNKPIHETVAQTSKYAKIYYYRFSYIGLLGYGSSDRAAPGVSHAEELNYIWYRNRPHSDRDWEVKRKIVQLWTNFAKYLNPTPEKDESLDNVIWPKARQNASSDSLTFLDIDYNITVSKNPDKDNLDFWNDLYKENGHPPYSTY